MPYKGVIPVGSDLILILIITGIFIFIIGLMILFRRKDLGSYFQNVRFFKKGYQGIPNSTPNNGHEDCVQMT